MKNSFEKDYIDIVNNILENWILKETRNWITKALFWILLEIDCLEDWAFPLLTTRKIFHKWILWEYAAIINKPKHIDDFKKYWCNYWDKWAQPDWKINIDYGNKWFDFHWHNQVQELLDNLKNNPNDRRLMIQAWDPSNLKNLDLPCCHYSYQFFVRDWHLDILWNQRSADFMIWVPSDIVLAAIMLSTFAKEVWLKFWKIKMMFWDAHIYEEHFEWAKELVKRPMYKLPRFILEKKLFDFEPDNLKLWWYEHNDPIKFLLKE